MVIEIPNAQRIYQALKAEGFDLPDECSDLELDMGVDGAFVLKYRVLLRSEALQKLGRAIERVGKGAD